MRQVYLILLFTLCSVITIASTQIGSPANDFEGKTLEGERIQLSDYKGKVVLIDIWASWCTPCRKEMPFLIELYSEFDRSNFEIIAINIDDKISNAKSFLSQLKYQPMFPIVMDPKKEIPELYRIKAMPTTILIDKTGKIRYWHNGFKKSHKRKYREELKILLSE